MSLCDVDGCTVQARARGWCGAHYERWRRHGDPTGVPEPRVRPVAPSREELLAEMEAALARLRVRVSEEAGR